MLNDGMNGSNIVEQVSLYMQNICTIQKDAFKIFMRKKKLEAGDDQTEIKIILEGWNTIAGALTIDMKLHSC